MRYRLFLVLLLLVVSCQSTETSIFLNLLEAGSVHSVITNNHTLSAITTEVGLNLTSDDEIWLSGIIIPHDYIFSSAQTYTLQIKRAHKIKVILPDHEFSFSTTLETTGQALENQGLSLFFADTIEPSLDTPILSDMAIKIIPSHNLTIKTSSKIIKIKVSQLINGKGLVSNGFFLNGLDKIQPTEALPIKYKDPVNIIRRKETFSLQEKTIPYAQKYIYSENLTPEEQKIIQMGESGLIVSRIRTIFEDNLQISQSTELETIIRKPIDSIVSISSRPLINTINTPYGPLEFWRAVAMYTTSYSPCRSGTSKCSYGTSSGLPVKQGVAALTLSLYNQLAGSRVYIQGYGIATIGDTGGGFPDGRLWIDLAYSDDDYQSWSGTHTVYFLLPAPDSIPPGL